MGDRKQFNPCFVKRPAEPLSFGKTLVLVASWGRGGGAGRREEKQALENKKKTQTHNQVMLLVVSLGPKETGRYLEDIVVGGAPIEGSISTESDGFNQKGPVKQGKSCLD